MKQIMKKSFVLVATVMLLLQLCISMPVYAADGNLAIAVSAGQLEIGETVTITVWGSGPNNEKATSSMEFTYNSDVFSFVKCDAEDYTGGEGGKVKFSGTSVNIVLKAVAEGNAYIKVTGSNGKIKETQEALSSMVAAGTVIKVAGGVSLSGDNSLSGLTISEGTLSPEFDTSIKEYTATVPYETTAIEIDAKTTNSKAKVESIVGNTELQSGENVVVITVTAENGKKTEYKITVTRGPETANQPGGVTNPDTEDEQLEEYKWQISRLQDAYQKLEKEYEEEKAQSRKIMAVLVFIIVVLLVICINLIVFRNGGKRRTKDDIFDDDDRDSSWLDDDMEVLDLDKY